MENPVRSHASRSSDMVEVTTIVEHEDKAIGDVYSVGARRADTLVSLGYVKINDPTPE